MNRKILSTAFLVLATAFSVPLAQAGHRHPVRVSACQRRQEAAVSIRGSGVPGRVTGNPQPARAPQRTAPGIRPRRRPPGVGGARTLRDLNGVEAGSISGETAFILPVPQEKGMCIRTMAG